jgi:hypothetical protein
MEIPPEALETDDSIMLSDLIKDELIKSKERIKWTRPLANTTSRGSDPEHRDFGDQIR